MNNKINLKNNILPLIGVAIGILIIILALFIKQPSINTAYTEYSAFGGDFYTEEYAATRNTANNVAEIGDAICKTFVICSKFILISMGLIDIMYFLSRIKNEVKSDITDIPSPVISNINVCQNCGNSLKEGDRFCQKCGLEFKENSEETIVQKEEKNVLP